MYSFESSSYVYGAVPTQQSRTQKWLLLLLSVTAIGCVVLYPMRAEAGMQCTTHAGGKGESVTYGPNGEIYRFTTYFPEWTECSRTFEPTGGYGRENGDGRDGSGDGSEFSGGPSVDKPAAMTCPVAGNPVVIGTGNKIEPELDFGTGGEMALHLARTWNQHSDAITLFGYHWISSFDYRLSFNTGSGFGPLGTCYARPSIPECTSTAGFTELYAHRPDGRVIKFVKNVTSGIYWEDKPGPVSKIVRQSDGKWLVTFEDNITELYSTGGYPLWLQDEHGLRWTFTYGGLNNTQVQRVTHASGRYVLFTWVGDELREIRDPAGNPYTFTYTAQKVENGFHLIDTTTLPGAVPTVIKYHYGGQAGEQAVGYYALTGKSYNGVRYSTFTYGSGGATATEHAGGVEKYTFVYTNGPDGQKTVLETNPLGKQTTYDFQDGRLLAITGHPSTHCPLTASDTTYDANDYRDKVTDFNGNVTDYDYNAKGQLIQKVEAYGKPEKRTTTYVWEAATNRISNETVLNHSKTSYTYDAGRIATVTRTNLSANGVASQARTTTYSYTTRPSGILATSTIDGPLSGPDDAVVYNYDIYGNLTSVQNGLEHTTTYGDYNALGQPRHVVGPNGDITDFVYDARGRRTDEKRWVNGAWQTTTYGFDASGRLASVKRPDGQIRTYVYDAAWRLVREYEPEAGGTYAQKRYTYNNASQVTRIDTERISLPTTAPVLTAPGTSSTGSYTVSWTAVGGATSYQLDESMNGGAWTQIHSAAAISKALSGKDNGTYSYRVKACDAEGCGPLSATKSVVVSLATVPAPTTLTSPPPSNQTGSFVVSWNAVTSATSYQLEESANGGAWAQIYSAAGTSTTRTKPNGMYSYRVKSCNTLGCSTYSATRTVEVDKEDPCPSCLMSPPAGRESARLNEDKGDSL